MKDRGNRFLRLCDRFGGIPLIFLLGLFRLRKRVVPDNPGRIALLVTAAIGDTILISALVKEIQQIYPKAEISLFCGKTNKGMAELSCPGCSLKLIPVNNPFKSISLIRKSSRFDIWIDTGPWPRINSLLSFFAKSRCKIGYRTRGQARHYIYDLTYTHRRDQHEMDNLRGLGSFLGIAGNINPDLTDSHTVTSRNEGLVIHMYPGGYKSSYKEWSENNWIELINRLTEQGNDIYITGAPVDRVRAEFLVSRCRDPRKITVFAGKTNLKQTGDLLASCNAVISVNTGIMHYAAALKVPLVALHGPTSSLRWGPLSDKAVSLNATSPHAGCLNLGFEYHNSDQHSMDTISVDQVLNSLYSLLKKTGGVS